MPARQKHQRGAPWTRTELNQFGRAPDSVLARRFRRAIKEVAAERERRRIRPLELPASCASHSPRYPRQHKRWTHDEDLMLGTQPDHKLARILGRPESTVRSRRYAKRIRFCFKPWHPEDIKLLGTRTDGEVAKLLGRTRANVFWLRQKLGIPCHYRILPWTAEQLELLGVKADEEVCRLTGHSLNSVKAARRKLGKADPDSSVRLWTPEEDAQLGRMPDAEVARKTRRSLRGVRSRRLKLQIPYRCRERLVWSRQDIRLLGAMPDLELAERLQCSAGAVSQKRRKLRVRRCEAATTPGGPKQATQPKRVTLPVWRRASKRRFWTPAEDKLLGTMPDERLAARLDRTVDSVCQRRHGRGIPPAAREKAAGR